MEFHLLQPVAYDADYVVPSLRAQVMSVSAFTVLIER